MRSRLSSFGSSLCLVGAAACSAAPAARTSSEPIPEHFDAGVLFTYTPNPRRRPDLPPEGVTVHFSDGGRTRTIKGRSAKGTPGLGTWYETRTRGSLDIQVILENTLGDTVAMGGVSLPLRPDWLWGVRMSVWRSHPLVPPPPCISCLGEKTFPLRPVAGETTADSLRIYWGGRHISIPNPPS